VSAARRAALVALATALVLAAFLGGRAVRSEGDGSAASAPAAEVEDPGKGDGLGDAAGLPRLRRDQPASGGGGGGGTPESPAQDTGTPSNDTSGTQQTQQPQQTQQQQPRQPPPDEENESFGGGTN
jgi:hypothetical protein